MPPWTSQNQCQSCLPSSVTRSSVRIRSTSSSTEASRSSAAPWLSLPSCRPRLGLAGPLPKRPSTSSRKSSRNSALCLPGSLTPRPCSSQCRLQASLNSGVVRCSSLTSAASSCTCALGWRSFTRPCFAASSRNRCKKPGMCLAGSRRPSASSSVSWAQSSRPGADSRWRVFTCSISTGMGALARTLGFGPPPRELRRREGPES
mmetsp:Transcript_66818/g.195370  ORF Transcript_66818/g.195370 Transcript_66818/m.195370 type:complete len:204 (+) Transcript_66818:1949-2560(+)